MSCSCSPENVFHKSLFYSSPAHGGWGVLKAAQLVPESYFLFVSPAACGRHGALGACLDGRKKRVSYLYLKEEDIVSGGYEDLLVNGVKQLFTHLEKCGRMPKAFGIFVSCIDDLLGTDHEALQAELRELYPKIHFSFYHMNPTSTDTSVPPAVNVQNKNYGFLDVAEEHDKGVNIIGNFAPLRPNGELFTMLKKMGASEVRHISDYETFQEYQNMAKSCLNLVVAPSGKYSALNMEKKHGIENELVFTTFRPEVVKENYVKMAKYFSTTCPDVSNYEQACKEALEETRIHLDGMPVVIGGESIIRPFDLARAMLEAGINVACVQEQLLIPSDKENYEWVREHYPELLILQPQSPEASLREKHFEDCLAIGYSAGYQLQTGHVVDIDGQHGLYGYQGIVDLMTMIRKAADETIDLKKVLDEAVLVV